MLSEQTNPVGYSLTSLQPPLPSTSTISLLLSLHFSSSSSATGSAPFCADCKIKQQCYITPRRRQQQQNNRVLE